MSDIDIELYREDGGTHHDVALTVKDDGAVHMSAYDLGEAPEKVWGHDDYEYWVDVSSTEVQSPHHVGEMGFRIRMRPDVFDEVSFARLEPCIRQPPSE